MSSRNASSNFSGNHLAALRGLKDWQTGIFTGAIGPGAVVHPSSGSSSQRPAGIAPNFAARPATLLGSAASLLVQPSPDDSGVGITSIRACDAATDRPTASTTLSTAVRIPRRVASLMLGTTRQMLHHAGISTPCKMHGTPFLSAAGWRPKSWKTGGVLQQTKGATMRPRCST